MRRAKAETLDDILGRLVRQQGLETPLNEYRLKAAWGDVAGRVVEQYTSSVQIYNQVLYVKLSSPALRANLMMVKTDLITRLNEHVGAQVIVNIVFK